MLFTLVHVVTRERKFEFFLSSTYLVNVLMAHKDSQLDATDLLDVRREWLQDAASLG